MDHFSMTQGLINAALVSHRPDSSGRQDARHKYVLASMKPCLCHREDITETEQTQRSRTFPAKQLTEYRNSLASLL
jgi:hypothetical protein